MFNSKEKWTGEEWPGGFFDGDKVIHKGKEWHVVGKKHARNVPEGKVPIYWESDDYGEEKIKHVLPKEIEKVEEDWESSVDKPYEEVVGETPKKDWGVEKEEEGSESFSEGDKVMHEDKEWRVMGGKHARNVPEGKVPIYWESDDYTTNDTKYVAPDELKKME